MGSVEMFAGLKKKLDERRASSAECVWFSTFDNNSLGSVFNIKATVGSDKEACSMQLEEEDLADGLVVFVFVSVDPGAFSPWAGRSWWWIWDGCWWWLVRIESARRPMVEEALLAAVCWRISLWRFCWRNLARLDGGGYLVVTWSRYLFLNQTWILLSAKLTWSARRSRWNASGYWDWCWKWFSNISNCIWLKDVRSLLFLREGSLQILPMIKGELRWYLLGHWSCLRTGKGTRSP